MKRLIPLFLIILLSNIYSDDFIIDEPQSSSQPKKVEETTKQKTKLNNVSSSRNLKKIGSVQTPITFSKGEFYGELGMYENGGINTRFVVGIFDIFEIGFTENLDNLIGSGDIVVNIPGAYMKLNILNNFKTFYWSIGFDNTAYGKNGTYFFENGKSATIYSIFTSMGWSYSLFGGSDFLVFGIRYPLLPIESQNPTNSSFFVGCSLSAANYFTLGLTFENIYLSFDRGDRVLPSIIFSLKPVEEFTFNFVFQYEFYSQRVNRILTVGYNTSF
ncbi:MAG: hypothetical protein N2258_06465 [Brevinematales bacterium]|nr:hypothetical protein [Brevinematales bacterium]